jgi:hypothetical protein
MIYEFTKDPTGLHSIGGQPPEEFAIPSNEFIAGMQYVGFVNRKDDCLSWLPFDLHIICPIYLDIEEVTLDYSDPLRPKIIYPVEQLAITTAYDELDVNSEIIFSAERLSIQVVNEVDDMECIGLIRTPYELQHLEVPICPKTGKQMQFVCQFMTFGEIPVQYRNFKPVRGRFEYLNFWEDGSLFVYCEPTAKTITCFLQTT